MILGRRIALLNKGSNHFMAVANDGHTGVQVQLVNQNPLFNPRLTWKIQLRDDLYYIRNSFGGFLDSRGLFDVPALVHNRYPYDDHYFQWKINPTTSSTHFFFDGTTITNHLSGGMFPGDKPLAIMRAQTNIIENWMWKAIDLEELQSKRLNLNIQDIKAL